MLVIHRDQLKSIFLKVDALLFYNERLKEYVIHRDQLVDGFTIKLKEVRHELAKANATI
jgi:hypothetical protein